MNYVCMILMIIVVWIMGDCVFELSDSCCCLCVVKLIGRWMSIVDLIFCLYVCFYFMYCLMLMWFLVGK